MSMNIREFVVPCIIIFGSIACCFAVDCNITPKGPEDHLARLQVNVICNISQLQYDVRPVKVNTSVTKVGITFQPKHISIVEDKEIMKVTGYLQMGWRDEFCQWKPSDYGSIEKVEVDHYDLWRPKLTTTDHYTGGWYDFLDENDLYTLREILVDFNGNVTCQMLVTLYGPCLFDLSDWPNDEWSCKLTLGKRSDDGGNVVVHFYNSTALDKSKLEADKDWMITKISDPACEDDDTRSEYVTLNVILKRQRSTIEKVYLIPAFVALMITLIPFWLTNKIFVRLAVHFLATFLQVILLQFVFTFVTKNHGLRTVGVYDLYLNGLYLNLVGIVITALNAKYNSRDEDPPKFILTLLSMLASMPYVGPCCSVIMNDGTAKTDVFDSDEDALISMKMKSNPKWNAFLNFIDKSVFFLIVLYICVKSMI